MTQSFDDYVLEYDAVCAEEESLKAMLKPISAKRLAMAKAIAERVQEALGDNWKEGVNNYTLVNLRTVKVTNKVDRKIDVASIPEARAKYEQLNSETVAFDDLLRVKYELAKREYDKLGEAGKREVSRMFTSKAAAPVVVLD